VSRRISDLEPDVLKLCTAHIEACRDAGITLLVYCTRRTEKDQALEYAKGRRFDQLPDAVAGLIKDEIQAWEDEGHVSGPGNVVTQRYGPDCPHVQGIAFDCVPEVNGKAVWGDGNLWQNIGELGETVGLEWGGRWTKFPDRPHFQRRRA